MKVELRNEVTRRKYTDNRESRERVKGKKKINVAEGTEGGDEGRANLMMTMQSELTEDEFGRRPD